MGQIKNIKLHIVTDIKRTLKLTGFVALPNKKMTNTVEKPVAEPVEEKKVEKDPVAEPESTTTEGKPVEPDEVNGNGKAEEENGNGHTEEIEKGGNGRTEETEEEETTLKRKDAPTEVEEDSPKKKKLIDSDEKEPETVVV